MQSSPVLISLKQSDIIWRILRFNILSKTEETNTLENLTRLDIFPFKILR